MTQSEYAKFKNGFNFDFKVIKTSSTLLVRKCSKNDVIFHLGVCMIKDTRVKIVDVGV